MWEEWNKRDLAHFSWNAWRWAQSSTLSFSPQNPIDTDFICVMQNKRRFQCDRTSFESLVHNNWGEERGKWSQRARNCRMAYVTACTPKCHPCAWVPVRLFKVRNTLAFKFGESRLPVSHDTAPWREFMILRKWLSNRTIVLQWPTHIAYIEEFVALGLK